jgi:hypothetical protein
MERGTLLEVYVLFCGEPKTTIRELVLLLPVAKRVVEELSMKKMFKLPR